MEKIKVLHMNHISRTGSGVVIKNIMNGLPDDEFDSHVLVGYDFDNCKNTDSVYKTSKSIFYRQIRYKFFIGINFLFDIMTPFCITAKSLKSYKYYQEADIIHIHCPQGGYFNRNDLPVISKEKKIVLTIHDDRISSGNDEKNLYYPYKTNNQFKHRESIFKKSEIHYVGVSDWCTNKATKSGIVGNNNIRTIYNGININIFKKENKEAIRDKLNIPQDKTVILSYAGSGSKTNMKGLGFTKKVIKEYQNNSNFLFITIGNSEDKIVSDSLWEIGHISPSLVAQYFNSADIFLYPTLMDSFGLVVAESVACGCPVVTFDIGGVPEVVQHKKNGYIAKFKDFDDLMEGIDRVMHNKEGMQVSLDPRMTQEVMVDQYMKLYKSIL